MIGLPSGWSNSEVRLIQNADCFRWRERTSQSSGNFLGRPVGYCCKKKKTLGQASQITAGREQHKAVQIKYQDQEHQTYFIIYFPINMDISVIFHQLYGYFPIFHQWDIICPFYPMISHCIHRHPKRGGSPPFARPFGQAWPRFLDRPIMGKSVGEIKA